MHLQVQIIQQSPGPDDPKRIPESMCTCGFRSVQQHNSQAVEVNVSQACQIVQAGQSGDIRCQGAALQSIGRSIEEDASWR